MKPTNRIAAAIASVALGVALVGGGVYAAYSDTATATDSVAVGAMDIAVSSSNPSAVVVNDSTGATHAHTVSLTNPDIASSLAGSSALPFTVTSTGKIPAKIHVEQTTPVAPFTSLLAPPIADVTLNQGEHHDYAGGLSWPALANADLSKTATITYNITVLEDSQAYRPPLGTFQRQGNLITIYAHTIAYNGGVYTFAPGDILRTYAFNGSPMGWSGDLAAADANGNIYYQGTTTSTAGNLQISVMGGPGHSTMYSLYPTRL